ncbi:MAG: cation:proton antiporter [Candidatus Hodarchaeales archaeon]
MLSETVDRISVLIPVLEIGVVIIFSLIVARILGKHGIPKVLGFIFSGMVLQFISTSTGFPSPPTKELHYIITTGALGFIGYSIGAHLDLDLLKTDSRRLIVILLAEAIGAFIAVFLIIFFFSNNLILALLLASIAMATAPASTTEIIREFKSEGPLTQIILFIIAFDDILAILFFSFALSYGESFFTGASLSLIQIVSPILIELIGSFVLGTVLALLLKPLNVNSNGEVCAGESAEYVFPTIIILISVAGLLHFNIILSSIVFGFVLSLFSSNNDCVQGVERLSAPLIALFFILIGFEMELTELLLSSSLLLVLLYFISRAIGKSLGSYTSSKKQKMPPEVVNNLPFSLLTQAGVAVGLAALAYSRLQETGLAPALATSILLLDIIGASVLIAEIMGPLLLKKALKRAREIL